MSDCGVCIGGGDYDGCPEFYSMEYPRARKQHRCGECGKTIEIGERYQRFSGKFDGDMFWEKTCENCAEIRDGFTCYAPPPFGSLWSEMVEYVFPLMTTSCFDKLKTPEDKAFLQGKWIEWKFER